MLQSNFDTGAFCIMFGKWTVVAISEDDQYIETWKTLNKNCEGANNESTISSYII